MPFFNRCPSNFSLSSDHKPVICKINFRPRKQPRVKILPPIDIQSLHRDDSVKDTFQREIVTTLADTDPRALSSDDLSAQIRSATIDSARKHIPNKRKTKFPPELTKDTIDLIRRKR